MFVTQLSNCDILPWATWQCVFTTTFKIVRGVCHDDLWTNTNVSVLICGLPPLITCPHTGLEDYMKRYGEGIRRVLTSFGPVPDFSGEGAKSIVNVSMTAAKEILLNSTLTQMYHLHVKCINSSHLHRSKTFNQKIPLIQSNEENVCWWSL